MHTIGIPVSAGITFTSLAVSAFALTSLDTSTRIARFMFQEFFEDHSGKKNILSSNRLIGTAVAVMAGGVLTISGQFSQIWPIFGSANQLLAALALLALMIWLYKIGKSIWYTLIPMIFMYSVTTFALISLIYKNYHSENTVLTILGSALLVLSVVLLFQAINAIKNFTTKVQMAEK